MSPLFAALLLALAGCSEPFKGAPDEDTAARGAKQHISYGLPTSSAQSIDLTAPSSSHVLHHSA